MDIIKTEKDFRDEALAIGLEEKQIKIYIQRCLLEQEVQKEISILFEKINKLLNEKRKVSTEFHQEYMSKLDVVQTKMRQEKLSLEEILMLQEDMKQATLNIEEKTRIGNQKIDKEINDVQLETKKKERELKIALYKFDKEIESLSKIDKNEEPEEEILTLAKNDDQKGSKIRHKDRHAKKSTSTKVTPLVETKVLKASERKTDNCKSRLPAARGDDGRKDAVDINDYRLRQATATVKMSNMEGGQGEVTVTDGVGLRLCGRGKQSAQDLTGETVRVKVGGDKRTKAVKEINDMPTRDGHRYSKDLGQGEVTDPKSLRLRDKGKQTTRELSRCCVNEVREEEMDSGRELCSSKQECLVECLCLGIDEMVRNEFIPVSHENLDFADSCIGLEQTKTDWSITSMQRKIQQLNVDVKCEKVSTFNLSYNFVPPAVLMKLQVRLTPATMDHRLTGKPTVRYGWPVHCKSMLTWQTFHLMNMFHLIHENISSSVDMPRTGIGTLNVAGEKTLELLSI